MTTGSFYQQIEVEGDSLPPLARWNPPLSGEMDCHIKKDGSWFLEGSKLEKPRLLRLLSKVLRHENGAYYLVSPVEKWLIKVEDLPFLVVELDVRYPDSDKQTLRVRTNVGDWQVINRDHFIDATSLPAPDEKTHIPVVHIRAGLMARFNRNTFLELAELLTPTQQADQYELLSSGEIFTLTLDG